MITFQEGGEDLLLALRYVSSHCSCARAVMLSSAAGGRRDVQDQGGCGGEPVGCASITARQKQISVMLSQGLELTVCMGGSSEM